MLDASARLLDYLYFCKNIKNSFESNEIVNSKHD